MNSRLARTLFVVIFVVVSVLFFWSSPPSGPSGVAHLDKVVHFGLFFIVAASLHYAFRLRYWVSLLILTFYGVSIEVIQSYIPGRGADIWDLVADLAGAVSFFIVFYAYKKGRAKRNPRATNK